MQPVPNVDVWGNQREVQVYEASVIYGRKVYYMKPNNINTNEIFGEVLTRDFLNANSYEMYSTRDNDTMYEGGETFGGFGFVPSYNSIQYIPIKFFKDKNITPAEGDLIYQLEDNMLFEVTKIGDKTEEYNGSVINNRLFNYKLYLKLYSLADDDFTGFNNTEAPELDKLDDTLLNNLNDTLTATINNENPVTVTNTNPFGDL